MYDLTLIGGGISCGLTLAHLLSLLSAERKERPPLRLLILDRTGEFGGGRAYGRQVHPRFLLNETVKTMDVTGFAAWLGANRETWLAPLLGDTDAAVQAWALANRRHLDDARDGDAALTGLHLPRRVFGAFMRQLLAERVEAARRTGTVELDMIATGASSVARDEVGGGFTMGLDDGRRLTTRLAVLGGGAARPTPIGRLAGATAYVRDLAEAAGARRALVGRGDPIRAVVIGGNAAAMEALHLLRHDVELAPRLESVVVVAPTGRLPDSGRSRQRRQFVAYGLAGLRDGTKDLQAATLYGAAAGDARSARQGGYTSLDFADAIAGVLPELLAKLRGGQRRLFVERYGARFTALNRHTPPEYAASAQALAGEGRLQIVAARALSVAATGDRLAIGLSGRQANTLEADLVIDATGTRAFSPDGDALLTEALGPGGVAKINAAGMGIEVSGVLEASPGLFVIGPSLAGHWGDAGLIWNVESAPRIEHFARRLAATLVARL